MKLFIEKPRSIKVGVVYFMVADKLERVMIMPFKGRRFVAKCLLAAFAASSCFSLPALAAGNPTISNIESVNNQTQYREILAGPNQKSHHKISLDGLTSGSSYIVNVGLEAAPDRATAMKKGTPVTDTTGKLIKETQRVNASSSSETLDYEFTYDASKYRGQYLYLTADVQEGGRQVASVGTPYPTSGMLTVPTFAASLAKSQNLDPVSQTLGLKVQYSGFVPNEKYMVKLNATKDNTIVDNKVFDFTPDASSGEATLNYKIDGSQYAGAKLKLSVGVYRGDTLIAELDSTVTSDLTLSFKDKAGNSSNKSTDNKSGSKSSSSQSVSTSSGPVTVKGLLTAADKNCRYVAVAKDVSVVDNFDFENLETGHKYIIKGQLVLKKKDESSTSTSQTNGTSVATGAPDSKTDGTSSSNSTGNSSSTGQTTATTTSNSGSSSSSNDNGSKTGDVLAQKTEEFTPSEAKAHQELVFQVDTSGLKDGDQLQAEISIYEVKDGSSSESLVTTLSGTSDESQVVTVSTDPNLVTSDVTLATGLPDFSIIAGLVLLLAMAGGLFGLYRVRHQAQ